MAKVLINVNLRIILLLIVVLSIHEVFSQNEETYIDSLSTELRKELQALELNKAKTIINKLDSILDVAKTDRIKGKVTSLKGNYFYRISNQEEALKNWLTALKYYEKENDSIGISKTSNNVSLILNSSEEYEQSLKLKKKALLFCPSSNKLWSVALMQNIASTYGYLKKYDSSFYYLDLSYKEAKTLKSKKHLGYYHHMSSVNFLRLKSYHKSIKHSDSVQLLYKDFIQIPMLENSIYYSAKALMSLGKYKEALKKAELSLSMVKESGMIINAADSYELISSLYEKLGKEKQSLKALKQAQVYKDSFFSLEKKKIILELEKKYQTEKKEKENLELKKETTEKDNIILEKNNVLLISFLSFALFIILLVFYNLRRYRNKSIDLQKSILKREKLEKELEIVRNNIAKDFHDDLGNRLARITTLSDLMVKTSTKREKKEIVDSLLKIKSDSEILYNETRDFMFSLNSNSDYIEELCTYLSDFAEELYKPFETDLYIKKEIDINTKLPHYWNRHIILIFKEAMTNTLKHANATEVKLSFQLNNEQIYFSFSDNGKGFEIEGLKERRGLQNMYQRAKKINANFEIHSNKKGTRVVLKANLSKM